MENETTQFNLLNKMAVRKFLLVVATMGFLSFSLNAQTEMSTNLQLTAK